MDEPREIAILCVLGVGLAVNLAALGWVIRHIIKSKKERTL